MYGRLADSVFLCCLAYGGIGLYNIICDLDRSFFDIIFQKKPLEFLLLQFMQGMRVLCLDLCLQALHEKRTDHSSSQKEQSVRLINNPLA